MAHWRGAFLAWMLEWYSDVWPDGRRVRRRVQYEWWRAYRKAFRAGYRYGGRETERQYHKQIFGLGARIAHLQRELGARPERLQQLEDEVKLLKRMLNDPAALRVALFRRGVDVAALQQELAKARADLDEVFVKWQVCERERSRLCEELEGVRS